MRKLSITDCTIVFFLAIYCILVLPNTYMDNIIAQVDQKITTNTKDLQRYAELISNNKYTKLMLTETDPSKILYYNEILTEMIANTTITNNNIIGVSIVDLDKNIFGFMSKNFSIIDALDTKYDAFNKASHISGFSGLLYNNYDNRYYYAYFMPIFDNRPGAKANDKLGSCVILSSTTELELIINNTTTTPHSIFMVVDSNNEVIVSSNSDNTENKLITQNISDSFVESNGDKYICTLTDENSIIKYKFIDQVDWKILSVIPIHEINSDLNLLLRYGFIFITLVIIVFLIMGIQFIFSITNPISKMTSFINKGAYHNLNNRLEIKQQNEIGQLAAHINYMLDQIELMTKQIIQTQSNMYEIELAKKRAELSALQSQINPHFLYNTLDCIRGYGYILNSQDIVEITSSLSSIMRYSIKGPEMVEVSKEINCIKSYLKIISFRFPDRFKFIINISDNILDLKIPRFILQPIIENAIYHGLEPKLNNGVLSLCGYIKDCEIIFEVKDNGKGIPEDKLILLKQRLTEADSESTINNYSDRSIGLLNINSKLKFLYGHKYQLNIESAEEKGTLVTIKIPFKSSLN